MILNVVSLENQRLMSFRWLWLLLVQALGGGGTVGARPPFHGFLPGLEPWTRGTSQGTPLVTCLLLVGVKHFTCLRSQISL